MPFIDPKIVFCVLSVMKSSLHYASVRLDDSVEDDLSPEVYAQDVTKVRRSGCSKLIARSDYN